MNEVFISPMMLKWACERAHVSSAVLAEKISNKVPLWLSGEAKPTFLQAQKVSKILHIPFGYLFLNKPPEEPMPLPDLRTVGDAVIGEISVDLREVILDALSKQEWYKEYAAGQGLEQLPFIGRFSAQHTPIEVAQGIAQTLGIDDELRSSVNNGESFLSVLIEKAEDAGILMMHSGIVGSHTRRALKVNEFRGFAISDPIAPLVFLNWKDSKAARTFTLIHELAHLWIGQSGVSDLSLSDETSAIHLDSETFCNAVAADGLVPEVSFHERWNQEISIADNAHELVRYYRVSSVVIGRRAYELGVVSWTEYIAFYQEEAKQWKQPKAANPGGNYYTTIRTRLGKRFAKAVVSSVQQGRLLYRDAGHLLGMKPSNISNLSKELGFK
ncbi:MAG: ImmA/IrrE family metallo-endopeptidase [Mariprofundaceae bacterium]|nr:ImmA/IrrE family metallo-endopeptidase [Mariprofundaceae bacterium]